MNQPTKRITAIHLPKALFWMLKNSATQLMPIEMTVIYEPFEDIELLDETVIVLQVMPRFSKILAGLEDGSAIQIPFYKLKK